MIQFLKQILVRLRIDMASTNCLLLLEEPPGPLWDINV